MAKAHAATKSTGLPVHISTLADIPKLKATDIVAMRGSILHELMTRLEDLADGALVERRKAAASADDFVPGEVVTRIVVRRENPVKVYREWRGLTQHQLADKAGLSQSFLAEIERGKTFAVRTARALAKALRVDIEQLI
jgi:DNA-binding XRE family transcriptional regulator